MDGSAGSTNRTPGKVSPMLRTALFVAAVCLGVLSFVAARADDRIRETDGEINISLPQLEAVVRKQGYVTGIAAQSLLDRATGFHDAGFGLDIVDWIMEPGSDEGYRNRLEKEL